MLLHVYVRHSVHTGRYPSMPFRWYPSMPCRSPGGVVSQHALQVSMPTPRGSLRGLAWGRGLQAHTQGEVEGSGLGGSPGPHLGGVSRLTPGCLQAHTCGSVSRPTPRRELEGSGLRGSPAPHQGGSWGVWPGGISRPTPWGKFRGLALGGLQAHTLGGLQAHTWGGVSRPTPMGSLRGLAWEVSGQHQGGAWGVWPGGSPGPHPGGSWGVWPEGGCPGPHPGGVSRLTPRGLQAHTWGVFEHALRQMPPPTTHPQLTATAAGGMHPTGMHFCLKIF